ncbi:hypothetical protein Sango_0818900 [Sesamum angolense]|uniref:GAG-pre-integrase domain-containing protein n=1 Tax=Sesamum angolense TaxID=2727404 RepID=A0AAE1X452_9LAMI|nr:hypothetical protein Sango_0818900 [Sesamum angolense]
MILRVEKQREVNSSIAESMQNVAMQTKRFIETGYRGFPRKRDKQGMICEKCGKTCHSRETCFEIHGIPEWYKALVEKRKQANTNTSRALNTIEADFENSDADHKTKNIVAIGRMVGSLYVLEEQSFKEETIKAYQESKNASALNVTVTDIETWHKRLGHFSSIVLSPLPRLKDIASDDSPTEPLSEPKPVDTSHGCRNTGLRAQPNNDKIILKNIHRQIYLASSRLIYWHADGGGVAGGGAAHGRKGSTTGVWLSGLLSYRCRTRGPTLSGVCGAAEGSVMSGGGGRKTASPAQKTLDDTTKNGRSRLPPQPRLHMVQEAYH